MRRKRKPINRKKVLLLVLSLTLFLSLGAFYLKKTNFDTKLPATLAGEWVGKSKSVAVGEVEQAISIRLEAGQIVGTSRGANRDGWAEVFLRGSYEHGYLSYETYGGNFSGWSGVCQIRVIVEYREIEGVPHLLGTFEGIAEKQYGCDYQGTIDFVRSE